MLEKKMQCLEIMVSTVLRKLIPNSLNMLSEFYNLFFSFSTV